MEQPKRKKSKKKEPEYLEEPVASPPAEEVIAVYGRFPNIKRMLASLDKFLDRRIAGIAMLFTLGLIACGIAIAVNDVTVHAASDTGRGMNNTAVWLYSVLGVLAFVFLLVSVRVVQIRRRK